MDSFAKILHFLDLPETGHKEIIGLYDHSTSDEQITCDLNCTLNNETKKSLKELLTTMPFETSTIIQKLRWTYQIKHNQPLEDIIGDTISNYVALFAQDTQNEIEPSVIYSLISLLELCDEPKNISNIIFPELFDAIEKGKLSKDIVYLTLLPQNNLEILNELLKYERLHFDKCDLKDSTTLYRYCLYKNRHWLFHIIENDIDTSLLSYDIINKLLLLKLSHFTNVEPINIRYIENIVSKLSKNTSSDKFLQNYITEIKWGLNLYRYITKINPKCRKEFKLAELKSCLEILSSYIDLKDSTYYEEINEILINHDRYLEELQIKEIDTNYKSVSELDQYNGFCILTIIEYYITENKNETFVQNRVQELLKKTKQQLLQSKNIDFQLEIFENMFSLLFLRTETSFLCGKKEIYYISTTIKTILKEIKRKTFSTTADKQSKSFSRWTTLHNYVTDTLWRLDLLNSLKLLENNNIINMMLSSPNTLIYLCLGNDNFEKAHDVIQMYKMEDTHIAQEIEFIERIRFLRADKNINSSEIIKFCSEIKLIEDEIFQETSQTDCNNEIIKSFRTNETFMNIFDVALTLNNNYEITKELFNTAVKLKDLQNTESCSYYKFCYNILEVFNNLSEEKLPVSTILTSSKYALNINELQEKQTFYTNLETAYEEFKMLLPTGQPGKFNNEHVCQQSFVKLITITNQYNFINYLNRLHNYLKLFSELLYIKSDNSNIFFEEKDSCIFDILFKNPAEIVGKLLRQGLNPKELERLFSNLKIDIIYHISWNCLPEIDLKVNNSSISNNTINNDNFEEFLTELKQLYSTETHENISEINLITPDTFLLTYIRKRNWLLAYLINKVYLVEEAKPDTNSDRTKYFNNLLNLTSVKTLTKLFNNNNALTALYYNIPMNKILDFLDKYSGENINWKEMLQLINCLPERMLFNNENLIRLRDLVMFNLICEGKSIQDWKLVEFIEDNGLRIKCILTNLKFWPGDFCIEILNCQLSRALNEEQKKHLQLWLYQIELYENIKTVFNLESWNEVYEKSKTDSKEMFLLLLTSKQIVLLLKWIEIQKPKSTELLHLITINYFQLILEEQSDLNHVKTLLDLLQFDHRIQICKDLMKNIRKLMYLEFIINYLVELLPELESEYKNIMISLKIFSCFHSSEHEFMFCLIHKPLLILEQLLMNVRLEKLNVVLEKITPLLKDSEEKNISVDVSFDSIDLLLRMYAKKSVDFRGIQPAASLKSLELKLMQSLDTVSVDSERRVFEMPAKVPDKSEWVPNEQARECMCCHEVTFSMFNRRHHCRRCGRVVCGNCSHKTMEIPEYGSFPVRICKDCFKFSQPEDPNVSVKSEISSSKSGSLTAWLLSDDDTHNDIVRDEFSYEYAPSVSLCLSILKAHSNSIEHPRFLLEQCKILLPYLQDSTNEIDFSFVIQMIKNLVTVAKMTSLHQSYKTELSLCNEMLLHIELLKLLVEKGCLELLRNINKNSSGDFYINAGVLRRLRDKLIEQEQWLLALEVSTKVGLDKTGIFAAWGKSCLKAGCLQTAREKFQYCLEKSSHYDTSLDLSISCDPDDFKNKSHLKSVTLSALSEGRITKTPPLVNEIISVLESNGRIVDKSVFRTFQNISMTSSTLSLNTTPVVMYDPAVCVLNKLKNLKNIAGQNTQPRNRKVSKVDQNVENYYIEPCFYNECLYYLMRYASHSSILNFYLSHEEIDEALKYIFENRLQTEAFVEIYMKCLEDGQIERLQEHMQKMDSTLTIWEVYIKAICCHLETNSMYNTLYQLQIFMCDYVRAAMTCIKFYQEHANSFKELLDREEYLFKAQSHLKQELEQEQWVQIGPARKHSTSSSGSSQGRKISQPSLIMKIDPRNIDKYINTIWRQIEIAKFLAECEAENRPTLEILNEIVTFTDVDKTSELSHNKVPTLFDTQLEKTKLAVLAVVCGRNVAEGFGIAFRIIQDHNLKYLKIYCLAGKYFAQILQEDAVIDLISSIQSSGMNTIAVNETCDEVLMVAVSALTKASGTGAQLENLIKLINNNSIKIDAYIESKQLKRAYLLAIRFNKITDIKKILREAERLNQPQIKAICLKRLNQSN